MGTIPPSKFTFLCTIRLGTCRTIEALIQEIEGRDRVILPQMRATLQRIEPAPRPVDIKLVVVSVTELGLPQGASRLDLYNRAVDFSLKLCPPEVGPQLRLQYGQPDPGTLYVAMEPIKDSKSKPYMFCLVHGDHGRWLGLTDGQDNTLWTPTRRCIFTLSES